MRKVTITSRRETMFDVVPKCNIVLDGVCIGCIMPAETITFDVDSEAHFVFCYYEYNYVEKQQTNVIHITQRKDYNLVLGVTQSKTFKGRFKENITSFLAKGCMNIPAIELYEK